MQMVSYNECMIVKLTGENLDEAIRSALAVLAGGGIIAYPTETFYGLGAKYDHGPALERLRELKQRPHGNAMPLVIGNVEQLFDLADSVSGPARELIRAYWPGPLTILFQARSGLSEHIVSGGKVAVRVPGDSFALSLARAAGFPITATSANPSGKPPADSAPMVQGYFGSRIDLLIDCGKTGGDRPSTIVDASSGGLKILREGALDISLPGKGAPRS